MLTHLSIIVVIVMHIWFLILEMCLWNTPIGIKLMQMAPTEAEATQILALNQGFYNGILAFVLAYAWKKKEQKLLLYLMVLIVFAGILGAYTSSRSVIILVQTAPALLAAICLMVREDLRT